MRGFEPASGNTNPTLVGGAFQDQVVVLLLSLARRSCFALRRNPALFLREALITLDQGIAFMTRLVRVQAFIAAQ